MSASPTLTLRPRPQREAPSSCFGPMKNGPSLAYPMFPCCVSTGNLQLRSLKYSAALFFRMYRIIPLRYHGRPTSIGALMMVVICRNRASTTNILSCFCPWSGFNCTTLCQKGEGVKCLISSQRLYNKKSCDSPPLTPFWDKAVDDEWIVTK